MQLIQCSRQTRFVISYQKGKVESSGVAVGIRKEQLTKQGEKFARGEWKKKCHEPELRRRRGGRFARLKLIISRKNVGRGSMADMTIVRCTLVLHSKGKTNTIKAP